MARFYSTATNTRFKENGTSGGAKGQSTHARGWSGGVIVESSPHDSFTDKFKIYSSGGSQNPGEKVLIGTLYVGENGKTWDPV